MNAPFSRRTGRTLAASAVTAVAAGALALPLGGVGVAGAATDSAEAPPALSVATSTYTADATRIIVSVTHTNRGSFLGYFAMLDIDKATPGAEFTAFWGPSSLPSLSNDQGPVGCRGLKHATKPAGASSTEVVSIPASCLAINGGVVDRVRVRHEINIQPPTGNCTIAYLPGEHAWQKWLKPGDTTTDGTASARGATAARGC